jgi:hypothetical protein
MVHTIFRYSFPSAAILAAETQGMVANRKKCSDLSPKGV